MLEIKNLWLWIDYLSNINFDYLNNSNQIFFINNEFESY